MKKLTKNWLLKQTIATQRDLYTKSRKENIKNEFKKNKSIIFEPFFSLGEKHCRSKILQATKQIQNRQTPRSDDVLYLDFSKVETLYAPATIYFSHIIERYKKVKIHSRASSKSSIVRAMMTKLGLHSHLGLAESYSNHEMTNWHTFQGTDLTFGKEYDEIENILSEKLEYDTFLIVNDAISEAVSNVLNHAYDKNYRYLGWKVSLKVSSDCLSLVITDLGKSIPATVPDKIDDHMKNRLKNLFDFNNFFGMDDAQLIDVASVFRRTSTNEKHRGKGFGDMLEVCKTVKNSTLMVYSRKGIWASDGQEFKKMINFKDQINGTIIFWKLPLVSLSSSQEHEL
ncbi:ATP-binding protein [Acinetobacter bereziniae]|uniref:ATP-binding protein n=1 Tax=Acinetobacter bereziniae TaxID=106648 RepID=UPI002953BB54|nr:ATP-binding protein [Acinetobacter bereziniae]MDV8155673.1 ATP-binding protein [Acinetobacter bereziniae]